MRVAIRVLIFIWAAVSLVSLCGLILVFPSYSVDNAFAQALRKHPSEQASFWFHWCLTFFLVGCCITAWLYYTHRKHFGKLWKSD